MKMENNINKKEIEKAIEEAIIELLWLKGLITDKEKSSLCTG